MKTPKTSRLACSPKAGILMLALLAASKTVMQAADINWTGGTDSYTNPTAWSGGVVPGPADNAINDNGLGNVIQINPGMPDWYLNRLTAGNATGDGAYLQNGQAVNLNSSPKGFRLGATAGFTGAYTENGGAINFSNSAFNVGELGTGIFNLNGGSITGVTNITINLGVGVIPNAVTATMDGGTSKTGFTWSEQGFNAASPTLGLPAAGSVIVSAAQADHSYELPPSYVGNNAVVVDSNTLTSATMTVTAPLPYTALSFLGSAGNGPETLNYTVNHADSTFETGTISVPDWFAGNAAVLTTGARVTADGVNFQSVGAFPKLISMDVTLTNTTSAVTSVNLTYSAGIGEACLFALSGSTGTGFSPIDITGFNEDMVMEAAAINYVANTVTSVFNQTGGNILLTGAGQFLIGNYGNGVYNLSGGTNSVNNYVGIGRSGGNGLVNMTGGEWDQTGSGNNFLVGTGFQAPSGGSAVGVLNQSGGLISCQGQFLCPENSPSTGTYNLTNGTLLVNNWIAVGRNGGAGVFNLYGGLIKKTGGGGDHMDVGAGGVGVVNQYGGSVVSVLSDTWIGESSTGTWNMSGGTNTFSALHIGQLGSSTGTLNANGGVVAAGEITSGNALAFSTLNFNGTTFQVTVSTLTFLHDVFAANIQAGGAIFDSQGFNATIAQSLADGGGGGLTKLGLGTITLSGANSYSGPTVVSGGKLVTSTDSSGNGDFSVANGAGLGVTSHGLNAQYTVVNGSFASTATTLDIDLGAFGSPSLAPLNLSGTLTVNGTVTLNIFDSIPAAGQVPLVKYSAIAGSGSFVLGTLPSGSVGYLSNNVLNASIDLVITSAGAPRWDGTVAGGVWDINNTPNWFDLGTSLTSTYHDGTPVIFNDAAAGTTNVNLVTTVTPASLTFSDNSLGYVLTGTGKINGSFGLNKSGVAPVSILNTGGNGFTGPVVISGGSLAVTNLANGGSPSAIGASSANSTNLVLAGGAFVYGGAPVLVNRGFNVSSTNGVLDTEGTLGLSGLVTAGTTGGFIKMGPAPLALTTVGINQFANNFTPGILVKQGTLVLDGSAGNQTNHTVNEMWVGGTPFSGGALIVTNTVLNVDSWLGLGRGNGTVNNTSTVAIYNSRVSYGNVSLGYANGIAGNLAYQQLSMYGNSVLQNNGLCNLCESSGSTSVVQLNGSSVFTNVSDVNITAGSGQAMFMTISNNSLFGSHNRVLLGQNGATSAITIADSGVLYDTSYMSIGNGNGGNGSVTVQNNGVLRVLSDLNVTDTGTSTGSLNVSGNALVTGNAVYCGKATGSTGTFTVSGGTVIAASGDLQMGASGSGTCNQTGGTVIGTNWISIGRNSGGVGVYNISGGSLIKVNTSNGTRINVAESGTGTLNVSGTANVVVGVGGNADLDICSSGGNGTVNLNGGSITAGQVTHLGGGTATFNFNGGTLAAGPNASVVFMTGLTTASVKGGGFTVDTGTNNINIGQALLDGSGGGGLTKIGNGILRLNGTSTYTGTTFANFGGIGGTGTITAPLIVASGATLTPGVNGIGTFKVNNNVTLSAGSSTYMEVNKTAGTFDVLAGVNTLTYGGTLTVTNLGAAFVGGESYKLFNATNYAGAFAAIVPATPGIGLTWNTNQLAVNGTISVSGGVNLNPTNIVTSVSGGNLNLSWPADHTGYRLQIQTNTLATGLRTNWTDVPNSTTTNAVSIPIVPANPTVFLRLIYP